MHEARRRGALGPARPAAPPTRHAAPRALCRPRRGPRSKRAHRPRPRSSSMASRATRTRRSRSHSRPRSTAWWAPTAPASPTFSTVRSVPDGGEGCGRQPGRPNERLQYAVARMRGAGHPPGDASPPCRPCARHSRTPNPMRAAIRFVLNDAFTSMRAEERQALLHVSCAGGRGLRGAPAVPCCMRPCMACSPVPRR